MHTVIPGRPEGSGLESRDKVMVLLVALDSGFTRFACAPE